MMRVENEPPREEDTSVEALQLVKNEERLEQEQPGEGNITNEEQETQENMRQNSPQAHSQSVITSRRAVRTITAAGHITTEEGGEMAPEDGVKDEPPEQSQLEHEQQLSQYTPKLEESVESREIPQQYEEERLRLAEAETARYLAFKPDSYRSLQSPVPADKRLQPQYVRPPQRPSPYGRGLALRYGGSHHVIVAQEGGGDEHGHEAFLTHKEKEQLQAYTTDANAAGPPDGRQYAAVLGEQVTASTALEMIQTTSLNNQQAVGVAYQQVKYETRGEGEPRPTTYASLQPVTSVHGGYAYAGQSPQYGSASYGAYGGSSKELLTLYGGTSSGAGSGARGDESPPGQLLYRSDPTLSSSSLTARGAHVVYGSVVPQSQTVYEAPPSPNSQQVSTIESCWQIFVASCGFNNFKYLIWWFLELSLFGFS